MTGRWFAECDDSPYAPIGRPWRPVLRAAVVAVLPVWCRTQDECEAFIATIPAGDEYARAATERVERLRAQLESGGG